jgi:SWI/SNF-related matrix-associated actin-dependent regulator 1 of chromatin subfamily A
MKLTFKNGLYYCRCTFEERHLPREAGFSFDLKVKAYTTPNHHIAARLREYADSAAKTEISKCLIDVSPYAGPLLMPPNLSLKPFQETAARFALSRNRSYLGLDPGLGKGVIAVVVANTLDHHNKGRHVFVYICPPFLALNVENEFKKWCCFEGRVHRYDNKDPAIHPDARVVISPDSLFDLDHHLNELTAFIECKKRDGRPVAAFIDEAQRYKTIDSLRTETLFGEPGKKKNSGSKTEACRPGLLTQFDCTVFLSGSPMPNHRPMELFPILTNAAPETIDFADEIAFGKKYCAGFLEEIYDGRRSWNFKGASNIPELKEKVYGKFMLRMRKKEVLTELPPKIEELLFIGEDLSPRLTAFESEFLKTHSPEDVVEGKILAQSEATEMHWTTYRRLLGKYKAPEAAKVIGQILESGNESLLVFAIHTDTIEYLESALRKYKPLTITGDTPTAIRQHHAQLFQQSSEHRLMIGNIQAMGIGFTLTKASRVLMVEFSFVPEDNQQAGDRAHRIGQTQSVFVQYLVYRNSLDRSAMEVLFRKQKMGEKWA